MRNKDPRRVGGRYVSGYWQQTYEVVAIDGDKITVRWEDGRTTTHSTPWDDRKDKAVQ